MTLKYLRVFTRLGEEQVAQLQIRRSDDSAADYELVRSIIDSTEDDYPTSVDELRSHDEARREAGFIAERLLAEVDGVAIGYAAYGHMVMAAGGDVFSIGLQVVPAMWGNGIGLALHDEMLAAATGAGITQVLAFVDERQSRGMYFAAAAGYRVVGKAWESRIDPREFVAGKYRPTLDRLEANGIEVRTLADLKVDTPDWAERLYRLYAALEADIPFPIEERPNPEEVFRAEVIDSDIAIPEAFFIAVDRDDWVGLTELRRVEREPTWLTQELTGVLPSHRRRGIATALKVLGLGWAKARGFELVRTWNNSNNTGMLAVNDRLGLTRSHAIALQLLKLDG